MGAASRHGAVPAYYSNHSRSTLEFKIHRTVLLPELALLGGVVESKTQIPILANFKIVADAEKNEIELQGTDLEVGLVLQVRADVKVGGSVTVPGKRLLQTIQNLPDGDISFKHDQQLVVRCGRSRFQLSTLPIEDYPSLPTAPVAQVGLKTAILRRFIKTSTFAITIEDSRYALSGALLFMKPGLVGMCATDGHRLSLTTAQDENLNNVENSQAIVALKGLNTLDRMMSESSDIITAGFSVSDNHLFFDIAHRLLIVRAIAGQFPAYEAVIPKGCEIKVEVARAPLMGTLKRAALYSDERSKTIRITLRDAETLQVYAQSDAGVSDEPIDATGFAGATPITMGFNHSYLYQFLNSQDTEKVTLEIRDPESAMLVRSGDAQYVVMPMRI